MPIVKNYLKFDSKSQFSVIASPRSPIVMVNYEGSTDRFCAVANCENVCVYDTKTEERVCSEERSFQHRLNVFIHAEQLLSLFLSAIK